MPMSWKTGTGGSIFLTPLIFGQNKTVPNEDDIDIMISTRQFLSGSLDTLFNSSLKASLWSGLKAQWKHSGTIICQMNETLATRQTTFSGCLLRPLPGLIKWWVQERRCGIVEWGAGAMGQEMGVAQEKNRHLLLTSLEPGHICGHHSPLQDRHPVSSHSHLPDWQTSPLSNKVAYTISSTSY